jgi:hypothetical protein
MKSSAAVKLLFMAAVCLGIRAAALNPALPPSGNFDLSHWKLTLPVDSNGTTNGTAAEIQVSQMVAGYTNALYFYTAPDGAMLFWCPVDGTTTSGSSYPRSELREMLNPSSTSVNWSGYGTHILTAQCKVTQIPSSKKVIIGQIHSFTGNAYPTLKLQYNNGSIEALYKFSPNSDVDTKYTVATGVALGNTINYQIKMADGLLLTTVNGNTQGTNIFLTDPDWTNQTMYFKAGNYCQDDVGTAPEGASVSFYALTASHATNPPAISTNPTNLTVKAGSNATFSVTASGTPVTYTWRLNGTNLPARTTASITITNAQPTNAGDYSVLVTNAAGAVTSSVATLTIGQAPTITNQPSGGTVPLGTNFSLSVLAGGTAPLTYAWFFNGTNRLAGETAPSLALNNIQPTNGGLYAVVITNAFGAATSAPASVIVYQELYVTNLVLTSPGNCSLTINGPSPGRYAVDVTTDLFSWLPLATNTTVNGTINFSDSTATNAIRFYRARWL